MPCSFFKKGLPGDSNYSRVANKLKAILRLAALLWIKARPLIKNRNNRDLVWGKADFMIG